MLSRFFSSRSNIFQIVFVGLLLAVGSSNALAQRTSSWLPDRGFPEIGIISKTKQASAEACRSLCLKNSKCEAWSFNSGFIGSSVCALSSSGIITMMQDRGSIAGFTRAADIPKESEPAATPVLSGPQRTSSWLIDKRPGLYTGSLPETKQPSAEMCRNRCLQNPECKGWSFRYASQGPGLEASIKDCRLSTQWFNGFADKGVISGEISGGTAETPKTAAATAAPVVGTPPPGSAAVATPAAPVTNPVVAALLPSAVADPGRRVALVIGNSAYKAVPALPNPHRDAEAVAAALRRTGFQSVTLANDLTREKLIDALRAFAAEAEKADWAMVYFAGHGIEIGGVNYLIPIDARLAVDRDVQFEAVPLEQVMGAAEGAKKFRLVLLDACRDNPFAGQMRRSIATRSIGRGLAQVEPDSGTLVVYAAKHGQTAMDGDGANSPFVSAFVKRLATPGLEIRKLFDLVRDDVMKETNRRQQPFSYGSVPGSEDFFFVANK